MRRHFVIPVLLTAIAIAAYATSFDGQFILDDEHSIIENAAIRTFPPSLTILRSHIGRSLVTVSLALNFKLGGLSTFGYHAFNLAVHILAGLTLYGLVRRTLLREPSGTTWRESATGLAATVALFWLVHPLQTASVTYIIQRCESMMGLFYLLTLYALVRGSDAQSAVARGGWYAAAVLSFAAGMCCKEVMVSAPVVAILYDRIFLAASWRELMRRRGIVYLGFGGCLLLAVPIVETVLRSDNPQTMVGFHAASISARDYAQSQPGVIVHYLKLVLVPFPQCLDYMWPVAREPFDIIIPASIVLAAVGLTIYGLWRVPKLGFCGTAFFLILAPTSSFVPIADLAFEHRMYVPLAPVIVLLVLAGHAFMVRLGRQKQWSDRELRRREMAVMGVTTIVLALLTATRNLDYGNEGAMWLLVTEQCPHNIRAQGNLGRAYNRIGRHEDARLRYAEFLRRCQHPNAHTGMAEALVGLGRPTEALEHYKAAVRLDPLRAYDHYAIGQILALDKKYHDAETYLRDADRLRPDHPPTLLALAHVLQSLSRADEAHRVYDRAVAIDPNLAGRRQLWQNDVQSGFSPR
ncbi:MAG: tetratricopeptide repeat protein [Planctomycetota bacterium]|jgi:Tfp pilus assembly protein PilF